MKEPWCRSSRFRPLGQMLISILRMENTAAIRWSFDQQGLLSWTVLEDIKASADKLVDDSDSEESEGEVTEGDI